MLADIQALAGAIGPRGTGTSGKEAAAAYVAERLTALGLPVERHVFRAVASQNALPLGIDLVTLLAVAIYPLGGSLTRWITAVLALSAAPMLWLTIRTSSNPLRGFLPKLPAATWWRGSSQRARSVSEPSCWLTSTPTAAGWRGDRGRCAGSSR